MATFPRVILYGTNETALLSICDSDIFL